MKVCTRMSWLNEYGWVQVKFASRFMTCYNQGMKVRKRAYHKRKDDSVRAKQPRAKNETDCQPFDFPQCKRIRLSDKCTISYQEFIKNLRNANNAHYNFVPIKIRNKQNPDYFKNIYEASKEKPTYEDINNQEE